MPTRVAGDNDLVAGLIAKRLLAYIDDEEYRRRILTQLNRHEARHALARAIFHGRRGEVRQRYREGQRREPGHVFLALPKAVTDGALRPLRDPKEDYRHGELALA